MVGNTDGATVGNDGLEVGGVDGTFIVAVIDISLLVTTFMVGNVTVYLLLE